MDYFIDYANHKDTDVYIKGAGVIPLKRGQHIFGTIALADFMGVDRQRIRSKLKILKNIEFLTIKPTNRFSIATILNYDIYNPQNELTNQQINQQLTSNQPATNQQLTTPNEYNNIKNIKNDKNIIKNIVDYLNKKTGKSFKFEAKETNRLIVSRLNAGFQEQDFFTVIDNKCAKWLVDPKMIEYLRPQTLFGTKFESYLNDIPHPLHGKVSETTIKNIQVLENWRPKDEESGNV